MARRRPLPAAFRSPTGPSRRVVLTVATAIGVTILGVFLLSALGGGFTKTDAGSVAVVRNGGPLDNNKIRQIIDPASALTWSGLFSKVHEYPAQQRFYTITSEGRGGDRPGVDVVRTPTADGVDVGIEATIYFTVNLDHDALSEFDNKFGTRRFRGLDGFARFPWEGDAGWSGFLDQIVRPVIDNDLREEINNFRCAELVSSCALVQNTQPGGPVVLPTGPSNNTNIAKIQQSVNESLARDLKETLGGEFLTGIKFRLAKVTLPPKVAEAVEAAQAAFAAVTKAQAEVQKARLEAAANEARQKGYQNCPACAQIDMLKAIPPNVTTFAPGSGFSITPNR